MTANFANQWLHLQNLKGVSPDLFEFPDFDRTLADAMRRETELLFDNVMREESRCDRTADCELHFRKRTSGKTLRNSRRFSAAVFAACL